jgi:hypothetical protein
MSRPSILAAIDSWLFFLLVAIAVLFRWLASKATTSEKRGGSQDESMTQPDRPEREEPVSDEEQIRRFLEALGQPRTSKPPPPVAPRTDVPPRPLAPVQPLRTVLPIPARPAAETRREVIVPEKIPPPIPEAPFAPSIPTVVRKPAAQFVGPAQVSEPMVEAYAIAPADTTAEKFKVDLQVLLASPSGLRDAIILREIFGPPRSLQPLSELIL